MRQYLLRITTISITNVLHDFFYDVYPKVIKMELLRVKLKLSYDIARVDYH